MHQVYQLVRPALIFITLCVSVHAFAQEDSDLDVIEAELKRSKPAPTVPPAQETAKKTSETEIKNENKIESILVPPLHWCRLEFLKKSIICVSCDQEYEFDDYIETFSEFLNKVK